MVVPGDLIYEAVSLRLQFVRQGMRSEHDRAEDKWRPLMAIAEQARWTEKAKLAITHLEKSVDDTESAGVLLLGDMRRLLTEQKTDRFLSKDLAEELAEMEERPWPEWKRGKPITVRQIARLLSRYGIVPNTIRTDVGRGKGYEEKNCLDAFARYLSNDDADYPLSPEPPISSVTTGQGSNHTDLCKKPIRDQSKTVTDEKTDNPTLLKSRHVVTDQNGMSATEEKTVPPKSGGPCANPDSPGCIGRLKDIGMGKLMCGVCRWVPKPVSANWNMEVNGDDDVPF